MNNVMTTTAVKCAMCLNEATRPLDVTVHKVDIEGNQAQKTAMTRVCDDPGCAKAYTDELMENL